MIWLLGTTGLARGPWWERLIETEAGEPTDLGSWASALNSVIQGSPLPSSSPTPPCKVRCTWGQGDMPTWDLEFPALNILSPLPGPGSVLPVDRAAGVCNPRPEGWTRNPFVGVEGRCPCELGHGAESPGLNTRTLAEGRKQVGRGGGTWQVACHLSSCPRRQVLGVDCPMDGPLPRKSRGGS